MYTLYYSRADKEIKVTKARKAMQMHNFTEEVTRFNNCYFLCSKRKPLIEKAEEIKRKWVLQAEKELDQMKGIIVE